MFITATCGSSVSTSPSPRARTWMRSPTAIASSASCGKSISTCSMPPCLPVTTPSAPFASPLMTRPTLPTQAMTLRAAFSLVSLVLTETPGSTWSAAQSRALSPTLTL